MNKSWFENTVRDWTPGTTWEKEGRDAACTLLSEISSFNGGDIINDEDISQDDRVAHAVNRAKEAIQRQINCYAQAGNVHTINRYYKNEIKQKGNKLLPFLATKVMLPRLDFNRASWEELERLPGIGKVTATRILEYRETVGPFKDLEEVRNVKGISKSEFEKFQDMVYLRPASEKPILRSGLLNALYRDPSIENYWKLRMDENNTIQETIIRELKDIRYDLSISKYSPLKILPLTRASSVKKELTTAAHKEEIESKRLATESYGRLIFDRQYAPFMDKLLSKCKASLHIVMFFFRFEDEKSYPTDPLVQKMIEAKKKGADIKVILDIDEAGDPYDSQQINSNIFKYLKSKKIATIFDAPDTVTHSKVIIIDAQHVVIGSHNWTAGSFYQYDDTSVYIDSVELAEDYERNFEKRWKKLSKLKINK